MHEGIREILTQYNDTLKGRCAVCLEPFCENEDQLETETFTGRTDLIRVDQCYHRFHLICLHRDWFMSRHTDKDEYGNVISYKLPEEKRCPICQRTVNKEEILYIADLMKKNPQIKNNEYG